MPTTAQKLLGRRQTYIGFSAMRLLRRRAYGLASSTILGTRYAHEFRSARRELRKMRTEKVGRVLLILGNGPSLERLNANAVRNRCALDLDVMCVNSFRESAHAGQFPVDQAVMAAFAYYQPIELMPDYAARDWCFFAERSRIVWIPAQHMGRLPSRLLEGSKCTVKGFDSRTKEGWTRNVIPSRPVGLTSTVANFALGLGIAQGYDRVLTLGIDNSAHLYTFPLADGRIVVGARNHGYGAANTPSDSYSETLFQSMAEATQEAARGFDDLSKFSGFPVFNLDGQSLIDAFPITTIREDLSLVNN